MTSCRPYNKKVYEEIQPNETAFVIPLEKGNKNSQGSFKSEEYLEQNKVAAKRIYIPRQWLQTGRLWFQGKYIPSVRIIKVDRAPVTREWTSVGRGTNGDKKEDIEVESKESIGFGIGITATASIPEEWAAKFLYNYSGRSLAEVMDKDVRAYIQNILTSDFGGYYLSGCQEHRKEIFADMREKTIKYFATMGVRIMNIGAAGQFHYLDPKIQEAINEKFASEMKIKSADNEVKAAQKFAQARQAIRAQKELDADINLTNSIAKGLESGKLKLPATLVIGDGKGVDGALFKMFTVKDK